MRPGPWDVPGILAFLAASPARTWLLFPFWIHSAFFSAGASHEIWGQEGAHCHRHIQSTCHKHGLWEHHGDAK